MKPKPKNNKMKAIKGWSYAPNEDKVYIEWYSPRQWEKINK